LNRIEAQASAPDFWSDQEAAQKLLQERSWIEKRLDRQEHFQSQLDDAGVLFEFAEEDESSLKELQSLLAQLEHDLSLAETEMLLAGDNDRRNAICTIHPGAGEWCK
jgi:peptide chain release factor 2